MAKRFSIMTKVVRTVLQVSLTSLVILSVVAFSGMNWIKNSTLEISGQLGVDAAEDSRAELIKQAQKQLQSTAADKAELIDEKLDNIRRQVIEVSNVLTQIYSNPDSYGRIPINPPDIKNSGTITAQVIFAENVDQTSLTSEVGLIGNSSTLIEQITAQNKGITTIQIGTESGFIVQADDTPEIKPEHLDPRERTWYLLAKNSGELVWTDVMDDAYGRGLGIVCAAPVFNADHQVTAVAAAGAILDNISQNIVESQIGQSGFVFLMNDAGQVILSPNTKKDEYGKIIRWDLIGSENESLRQTAQEMVSGKSGLRTLYLDGKEVYMAFAPLKTLSWSIGAVIDVKEVVAPAEQNKQSIIQATDDATGEINRSIMTVFVCIIIVLGLSIIMTFIFSYVFSSRLVRPIKKLTAGVREISSGNLDLQMNIRTGDEIESLAISFNAMTKELQEYMSNLTKVTADKERIATELNVATQIQTSMLPCIFPAFPDRSEFDIYASMNAAKEVGGDFYDFFLIDKTHLAVVIADVSGKGVPAALFMVIAKTLIKNQAQLGIPPSEVFETVNNQLCESNDAGMFVTAFLGILEIETGRFVYVNAGHNPPLISRDGGSFVWLDTTPGFVLAGMEEIPYVQQEIQLKPGDRLFLYTDGITEALNPAEELYSDQRLIDFFNSGIMVGKNIGEILAIERQDIRNFADGAEQADDITMLILKVNEWRDVNGGADSCRDS